jgi:hypothetical protein
MLIQYLIIFFILTEEITEEFQAFIHSIIPFAFSECSNSLPFPGASSIPLCYTLFLPLFSANYQAFMLLETILFTIVNK